MSYINMDHAGWVENSIAAHKKQKQTARDRRSMAEHKGWFAAPDQLNAFQRRAFDILGIVGNGIYNAPIAWDTVYWDQKCITCAWFKGLGTFDFSELTRLVILCHHARIRGYVAPLAPRYLEITLHERQADGGMSRSHPNLFEALEAFEQEFPADHSIVYRAPATSEAAE